MSKLLNISQTSKMLGVHPDTLRRWEKTGKISSIRIGSRKDRRYDIDKLYAFIKTLEFESQPEQVKPSFDIKEIIQNTSVILLDASDTLIVPFPSRGDLISRVCLEFGFKVDPKKIETTWHKHYNEWEKEKLFSDESIQASTQTRKALYSKLNADVIAECGVNSPIKQRLQIGEKVFTELTTNGKSWEISDGVKEFLSKMKDSGKRLAIIENWNKDLVKILKELGINNYFEIIVSGGELGMRKPKKEIFMHTLNILGIKANQTVYIGNRYIDDVIGPQNAGIQPLLYDPNQLSLDLEVPRFSSFEELA